MMSFEEFGEVVGLEQKYALDEKFAAPEELAEEGADA